LDHVQPVSRGGSSKPENLQLLCRLCNNRKLDHLEADAPELVVMRWCEKVFGHSACNGKVNTANIRRLLAHLELNQWLRTKMGDD
jgi:uncharacterized protein YgiB involved in biofilm formation